MHATHNKIVHRVLLVDDHQLMRQGVRALLASCSNIEVVVAEAADGRSAINACREFQPDVVLMDLSLPEIDGIESLRLIRRRWPEIRVLALTSVGEERRAAEALDAGAHGYVLKRSSGEALIAAILGSNHESCYIDPALDASQVAALRGDTSGNCGVVLTPREKQILKLVAEGSRNRDIAEKLIISLKTVETHRLNVMRKLNAHNAAELAQWARRLGILDD